MDPDGTIAPLLLTLFILVAASAFFSMCESAMVTLSDSRLKRLVEDGDNWARKLLDKLDHPSRFWPPYRPASPVRPLCCRPSVRPVRRWRSMLWLATA